MDVIQKIDNYVDESDTINEGLESDSDMVRKLTGRLSKKDTALRLSRISIDAVLSMLDDYNKGRLSSDELGKMVNSRKSDLISAKKSIDLAKK